MSNAYKCDKCSILYEREGQAISVPSFFERQSKLGQTFLPVWVGVGNYDLCPECVEAALEIALAICKGE